MRALLGLTVREDCMQRHVMLFVPLNASAKLCNLVAVNVGSNLIPAFKDKMRPVPFTTSDRQSRLAVAKIFTCPDCALGNTNILKNFPSRRYLAKFARFVPVLSEKPADLRGDVPAPASHH